MFLNFGPCLPFQEHNFPISGQVLQYPFLLNKSHEQLLFGGRYRTSPNDVHADTPGFAGKRRVRKTHTRNSNGLRIFMYSTNNLSRNTMSNLRLNVAFLLGLDGGRGMQDIQEASGFGFAAQQK